MARFTSLTSTVVNKALVIGLALLALTVEAKASDSLAAQDVHDVSVVFGCLTVPSTNFSFITTNLRDAFSGHVGKPGGPRILTWATGLWEEKQPPPEADMKSVAVLDSAITYWSEIVEGKEVSWARFHGALFGCACSDPEEMQSFLNVVKTYRPGVDGCEGAIRAIPTEKRNPD